MPGGVRRHGWLCGAERGVQWLLLPRHNPMRRHTAAERRQVLHLCLLSATVAASSFVAATVTAAILALAAAVVALAAAGFDYNDWELLCHG